MTYELGGHSGEDLDYIIQVRPSGEWAGLGHGGGLQWAVHSKRNTVTSICGW